MTLEQQIIELETCIKELWIKLDAEMERLKACEHIAEGDEGWQILSNLCPSTAAVAKLRTELDDIKSAINLQQ